MSGRARPQTAHPTRRGERTAPPPAGGFTGVPAPSLPTLGPGGGPVQRPTSALRPSARARPMSAPVANPNPAAAVEGTGARGTYFAKIVEKDSRPSSAAPSRPGSAARPLSARRASVLKEESAPDPKPWHRFYLKEEEVEGRISTTHHFDVYNSWEAQLREAKDFGIWKFSRHYYSQGHDQATGQWRKFASRPAKQIDIEEISKQIVEMAPRTVHDVKPLLVLAQGLLRELIGGKHELFLKQLDEERRKSAAFEKGLRSEIMDVIKENATAFTSEVAILRECLESVAQMGVDPAVLAKIDQDVIHADTAAAERQVRYGNPEARTIQAIARLQSAYLNSVAAEDAKRAEAEAEAATKRTEQDKPKRPPAKSGWAIEEEGEEAEEEPSAVPPSQLPEPLGEKVARGRDQEMEDIRGILASTQEALASLQRDRDTMHVHLQQAAAEMSAAQQQLAEQEAELKRLRSARPDPHTELRPTSSGGGPLRSRVADGVFGRLLERHAHVANDRAASAISAAACQLLSDITGGLAVYAAKLVPPDALAEAPTGTWAAAKLGGVEGMGLEYIGAEETSAWMVGKVLQSGVGVTFDALSRDRTLVVRDVNKDPRVFWWRSRDDPPKVADRGARGRGFTSSSRAGALAAVPIAREGAEAMGVLVVDTVGRRRKVLTSEDLQFSEECAACIGEVFSRLSRASEDRIDNVSRMLGGHQSRMSVADDISSDLDAAWMDTLDSLQSVRGARAAVEAQAIEFDIELEMHAALSARSPPASFVQLVAGAVLLIAPAAVPEAARELPMRPSEAAGAWEGLLGALRATAVGLDLGRSPLQAALAGFDVAEMRAEERAAFDAKMEDWDLMTEKGTPRDGSRIMQVRRLLREVSFDDALRAAHSASLLRAWLAAVSETYRVLDKLERLVKAAGQRGDGFKLWEVKGPRAEAEVEQEGLPQELKELVARATIRATEANKKFNPLLARRPEARAQDAREKAEARMVHF